MRIAMPWSWFKPRSRGMTRFEAELSKSPVGSSTTRKSGRTASARAKSTLLRCPALDRKSTRLNSSHLVISYAVFCLKKKKKKKKIREMDIKKINTIVKDKASAKHI